MLKGRTLFGIGFIVINLLAYGIMLQTGELLGDVKGVLVQDYGLLHVSALLVCFSYFIVLFVVFEFFIKIKVPKIRFKFESLSGNRVGVFFSVLQMLFLSISILNGVNIAGSGNATTNSIFSIFWVFFPVDLLLVIYYSFYRDSSFFKVNIIIAIISSLLRGRADVFLMILFFEISRKIRNKSLSFIKIFFVGLGTLCLYPVLIVLKFAFRLYLGEGGDQSLDVLIIGLMEQNQKSGFFYSLYFGFEHILGRLQTVSIVAEIARFSSTLRELFSQGGFYPFWLEGLHGIILDQVLGHSINVPLGTAFTGVGDFNWQFDVGDWNTNPGLVGWVVLNPLWTAGYIFYIAFLCFFSVVFTKIIGDCDMRNDMLWYSWAFYLMPAWLGVFFLFTYTLLLFFLIKCVMSFIPPIKLMGRTI
jgi:hypothetical protein